MRNKKSGNTKVADSHTKSLSMGLRLLQWNACGIRPRLPLLKQLLASKEFDVICIQETFLKKDMRFEIEGYNVIRNDRTTAFHGGLAILIRENLGYTVMKNPTDIEGQVVDLAMKNGRLTIVNVYVSPVGILDKEAFMGLFEYNNSIIVGDMNARHALWGAPNNDARGRLIADVIDDKGYVVLNTGQPTHQIAGGGMSHLDLSIVTSSLATKARWFVLNDTMGSDHCPIQVELNTQTDRKVISAPRWLHSKADWAAYRSLCGQELTVETTEDQNIDTFNDNVIEKIIGIAEVCVPQTKPGKGHRIKPLPYWNDEIKSALLERNRARNKMNRSKNLDDYIEYKRLRAMAQRTVRTTQVNSWRDFCSNMNSQTKLGTVWKMARKLDGNKHNPTSVSLRENGNDVDRDSDKAELFAKKFAEISSSKNYSDKFRTRRDYAERNESYLFDNDAPDTPMSDHLNAKFSLDELRQALGHVRKNKSGGEDRISYEFLMHLPENGLKVILNLYNRVWENGELPSRWKHSIVLPILKAGKDPHEAGSYRPISLTSTVCKLMERMIANRLTWYLEKFHYLSNDQSGFRRHRSTIDQIIRLQDRVIRHVNSEGYVLAVFVDMEKAFDMIWANGLMLKLKKRFGINGHMFAWLKSFLSDRTIQVKVGNTLSSVVQMENGSAQGSMLSPVLYLCSSDDLLERITEVDKLLFADDGTLVASGKSLPPLIKKLQTALDIFHEECENWGFNISAVKTVTTLFTRKIGKRNDYSLVVGGKTLPVEHTAKLLGMRFDTRMTWSTHINYVRDRCRKRLNLMRAVSGRKWGASKNTLLQIYRALIRSIIDYGAIAYDSASPTMLTLIDRIQSEALRICCGAMKGTAVASLQVECCEMPLSVRRQMQQVQFAVKVRSTENHTASIVFDEHWTDGYGKTFNDQRRPIAAKVKEYFDDYKGSKVTGPTMGNIPPWLIRLPRTDMELSKEINKRDNPVALLSLSLDKIAQYGDCVQMYTDASKTSTGTVGVGLTVRRQDSVILKETDARVSDGASVFTGELTAIIMAIRVAQMMTIGNPGGRYAIFSDSLSVIKCFQTGICESRPNLFTTALELIYGTKGDIVMVWVPSHIGIPGNEQADLLANRGSTRTAVNISCHLELSEAYSDIKSYFTAKWQTRWDNGTTGSHYRAVESRVTRRDRLVYRNRALETHSIRLRLGMCWLNACLHKIGLHSDGCCDLCKVPETVEHYLLDCKNEVTAAVKQKCVELSITPTLTAVLNNVSILETIHRTSERKL